MVKVGSRLEQLAQAVSAANLVVQRKKVLMDKAEAAFDRAHQALCHAEWAHDDYVIQTWDKPDVGVLLNIDSNDRYYHELRTILKSQFGDALYVGGQWGHAPQHVVSIAMDAGEAEQVELAASGIFFFINDVNTSHPDAKGYGVFPVSHKYYEECAYELWFAPSAGEVFLVKRVECDVVDKQQFLTLRECLTFIHENLSNNYSN